MQDPLAAVSGRVDHLASAIRSLAGAIPSAIGAIGAIPGAVGNALRNAIPPPQADPGAAARQDLFHRLNPTGKLEHQSYLEGGGQPVFHNKTAVYLDGRIIGETLSSELAQISTFPRQAPYGDSYLGWNAPDNNISWA